MASKNIFGFVDISGAGGEEHFQLTDHVVIVDSHPFTPAHFHLFAFC